MKIVGWTIEKVELPFVPPEKVFKIMAGSGYDER
jgi:hypothetical protein